MLRAFVSIPTPSSRHPLTGPRLRVLALGLLIVATVARGFAQSEPPPSYYAPAIGTTGAALKAALHNVIKNHTVLPYTGTSTDTWDAVKMLDEDPADSASVVLIYSGLTNLKTNQYAGGVGAGKWDREHLFPQSFGLVAISASSRAKTDVFNLRFSHNGGSAGFQLRQRLVGAARR